MDSDINFIPMINYYNRAKGNGTLIIKENYTISSDGTVMYTDNQTVRLPTEPSTQIASAQSTIEQSFVQPEVAQAAVAQVEAAQPTKQPTKQPIDDKHLLIYLALIMGILLSIIPGIIFKDNEIFFISSISIAVVCGLILMYYFTIDFIIN
jgi:thiol:disulfide interchange protein